MTLGTRLKKLLKERGFTQGKLAELAGFRQSDISDWVNDVRTPRPEALSNIANALGVTVSALLGESEQPLLDIDKRLMQAAQGVSDEVKETAIQFFKFIQNSKSYTPKVGD